jgi:lipoprotein-anchoring transpeptidase ErfK/SrfK
MMQIMFREMTMKVWMAAGWMMAVGAASVMGSTAASAGVIARVDLGRQKMEVFVDGKLRHSWAVSSGRRGYETPSGNYRPQRLEREWYSRQYDDAPMPYSVFFKGGYAVHGGHRRVGGPASHGCIRLTTGNAATFYNLVSAHGSGSTRIVID